MFGDTGFVLEHDLQDHLKVKVLFLNGNLLFYPGNGNSPFAVHHRECSGTDRGRCHKCPNIDFEKLNFIEIVFFCLLIFRKLLIVFFSVFSRRFSELESQKLISNSHFDIFFLKILFQKSLLWREIVFFGPRLPNWSWYRVPRSIFGTKYLF